VKTKRARSTFCATPRVCMQPIALVATVLYPLCEGVSLTVNTEEEA
jgi:hypothetical protein